MYLQPAILQRKPEEYFSVSSGFLCHVFEMVCCWMVDKNCVGIEINYLPPQLLHGMPGIASLTIA